MKRASTVAVVVALAAAVAGGALARPAATPVLKGSVGPGYTISLTMNGKKVKTLKAGRYKFVIADKASIHNFTLEQESGGSFEQDLTDISDTGKKTVEVTLGKGEWKFYCSAHESQMNGSFTVS